MIENRDFVFLSNIPWGFSRQRHQQLAVRLARKNRVLFVEPSASPLLLFYHTGFFREACRRILRGFQRLEENLLLYTPPPLLPGGGRSLFLNRLNQSILTRSIRKTIGRAGFSDILIWNFSPYYAGPSLNLSQRLTIYDCTDELIAEMRGAEAAVARELEAETLSRSDLVLTTSRYLYESRGRYNPHTYFVPNGADADRYRESLGEPEKDLPEIDRLPFPRIGFTGTFNTLQDYELLGYLASRRPEWSFVFIGTIIADPGRLNNFPNVHFLGPKPIELVPHYLRKFSLGIMVFRTGRETRGIHPLKAYDYLSLGLPVVSTALPECEFFQDYITVAQTREEFLKCIEYSLTQDTPELHRKRMDFARDNSWDARVEVISLILKRFI
jgi:glycosyltransferase involved in cell wall biosynthesis